MKITAHTLAKCHQLLNAPQIKQFKAPSLHPNVVPVGHVAAVAMDYASSVYDYANGSDMFVGDFTGFPGYPYLSQLTTRAEFRQVSTTTANEMTREWITIQSKSDEESQNDKINAIENKLKELKARDVVHNAVLNDGYFGRGQIYFEIDGQVMTDPLVIHEKTIPLGSLKRISSIEPMWTTPSMYNALKPEAPDFYKPNQWFMLGRPVHSSRLMTIIMRPMPDMLKPAYNFSGMSLTQMIDGYVQMWLRCRQSVSDLLSNFSTTVLKTDMSQVLQGGESSDVFNRADLFTMLRSNKGLMLLDKDAEDMMQLNTPLGGLSDLQAQSLEHICVVSRIPSTILTGISPSGMNASSDGEIRVFYDWISSQQEVHLRPILDVLIKIIQLDLFGVVDDDIEFTFNPLWSMNEKEQSEIRTANANADQVYISNGVLSPDEVRERLATDKESIYQGLDLNREIEMLEQDNPFDDGEGDEGDNPAMDEGKWITTKPSHGGKGSHVMIDGETGEVKAGMGGKFNGKNIKDIHGTKKFTGGETNAETEKRNNSNTNNGDNPRPEKFQQRYEGDLKKANLEHENEKSKFNAMTDSEFEKWKSERKPSYIGSAKVPLTDYKSVPEKIQVLEKNHQRKIAEIESEYQMPETPDTLKVRSKKLGDLKGTEKQVSYANDIREKALKEMIDIPTGNNPRSNALWGKMGQIGVIQSLINETEASKIIENRNYKSWAFD